MNKRIILINSVLDAKKATFADTFKESVWQLRLNPNGKPNVQRTPRKYGIRGDHCDA